MAIRFPRVLIACGLPTILAIVSYYWLRKRRKAVVDSFSPKQSEDSSSAHLTQYDQHHHQQQEVVHHSSQSQSLSQYEMQLKENNNCGAHSESATADRNGGQQMASNHTNHSSAVKRQISCDNATNECNGNERQLNHKFSGKCEDSIVVKLTNFKINDKDIEVIETINNSINTESKCDNSVDRSADKCALADTQPVAAPEPVIVTTVGSHNDNNDCNDSKSITNTLDDESICENHNNDTNHTDTDGEDCQHIQVLEPQKESSQQLTLDITPDGLNMSQTNSIDNASSVCSSSASCLMTNGYDTGDMYQNYPDSVSNGVYSPPHSAFSDVHSEGSSDSAKGGSDIVHTTPIDGPLLNQLNEAVIYQFEIPQYLCGRLIGSGGRFVTQIKRSTNTSVVINKHVVSSDMKICTLTGTKLEIREALRMIRLRFPTHDYPNVTLQQINLLNASQTCPMPVQTVQLQLPSGICCDVILSSMVSAGHFFLQQPTHPTYPSLSRLDDHMIQTYSQQTTPLLPTIHSGMICAVPIMGGWYRAVISKVYDTEECDVMFVDYGGFSRLPVSSLRQIRYDFMSLPFQASECYLANVEPINPETGWTAEANGLFEELAQGQILQAYIVGYADNGIPLVNLFKVQGVSNVFINQELVNQSHAQWVDNSA